MKQNVRRILVRIANIFTEIFFWCTVAAVGYLVWQIFFFASFRVPSGSMYPTIIPGDYVLVSKLTVGARLFDLFAAAGGERVKIYRAPGLRKIRRNDVTVFHIPCPDGGDKMKMHLLRYFIKRCTGLPGDSLEIRNGYLSVRGFDEPLGNLESQRRVSERDSASFGNYYNVFPFDSVMAWNIHHFGPLYIPRQGDTLPMTREHFLLYRRLIAWEQQAEVTFSDSAVYIDSVRTEQYCFQKNYYFFSGDYTESSQDSRYWGLAPEEYIVGKAWIIWKSVDPQTKVWRKERTFKVIN